MARSSRPSLPRASDLRRSHGNSASLGERPLRTQMVIAGVLVVILVAVPLYLLRRPSGATDTAREAEAHHFGGVIRAQVDAGARVSDVVLGPIQRVKCGPSLAQANNEGAFCDALPALEAAFRESIKSSAECAPRTGKEGSINYVLELDFASNRLNVFPGKSGNWRGPRARRAASCVLRAFPPVSWAEVNHQHQYYAIAILTTYPTADPFDSLPTFE
jgi:hypothetical protein